MKKANIILFLFLIITEKTNQICLEGCLKCNPITDTCLFCDFQNNYYLKEGNCAKKTIENCQRMNHKGECIECLKEFAPYEGACKKVTFQVKHCITMKNPIDCEFCQTGYYYNNNACVAVPEEIDNCKYYSNEDGTTCAQCNEDAFLYLDKRYCVYLEDFEGCAVWTQIFCKSCISGFFYNRNAFSFDILTKGSDPERMEEYIYNLLSGNRHSFVAQNCIKTGIQNCIEFEENDVCSKCKDDYILYDNRCISPKVKSHSICILKNSDDTCKVCLHGYYIKNGVCYPVDKIANCIKYNQFLDFTRCQKCSNEYFLDLNKNICKIRLNSRSIENCVEFSIFFDKCEKCDIEYEKTEDGLKCLLTVLDCVEYEPSNLFTKKLICKKCLTGKFLNQITQSCGEGTVENCLEYKRLQNECVLCENGFYLNNSLNCVGHTLKDYFTCGKFSSTINNYCEECTNNSVRITNRNFCREIILEIPNCLQYASSETCEKCSKGYVISSDQKSCIKNSIENCEEEISPTLCVNCIKSNFDLLSISVPYKISEDKSTCNIPELNQFIYCSEPIDNESNPYCESCEINYYPSILHFNSKLCLKKDSWKFDKPTILPKLDFCLSFDLVNENCTKCETGKVLKDGACIDSCDLGEAIYRRKIKIDSENNIVFLEKENYCGVSTVSNCELYDFSVRSEDHSYSGNLVTGCIQCKSGFRPVLDLENSIKGQAHNYNPDPKKNGVNNRYSFIYECVDETFANSNKLTLATSFDNCKFLIKSTNNLYGCFSCQHEYTGTIQNADSLYFIETCIQMTSCKTDTWFAALGSLENQLHLFKHHHFPIDLYVSCHECLNSEEIIFFGISTGETRSNATDVSSSGGLSNYSLTDDPPYLGNSATQTICSVPDPTLDIPDNCGIVSILTDLARTGYVNGETDLTTGFRCVACKNGFKPSFNAYKIINKCEHIENCLETQFNGCKKCVDNFSFNHDITYSKTDFSLCVDSSNVPFCYSGLISFEKFYCQKCFKGYFLNKDGHCDKVDISNCTEYSYFEKFTPVSKHPLIREIFENVLEDKPSGCYICESDYISTFDPKLAEKNFCIENTSLKTKNILTSDKFVDNCISNFYDLSLNKIRCKKCLEGFLLVSGKCITIVEDLELLKSVGECDQFDNYTHRCVVCQKGFFLNGGVCYKGYIPNCTEYLSMFKCKKCEVGYAPLTLNPKKAICFEISEKFNCLEWNYEASLVSELECSKCKNGMFPDYNIDFIPPYLCFPINAVENCEKHQINYDIKISSFNCLYCKDGFFLIDNFCIPRSIIDNCFKYALNKDNCIECEKNFILNEENECEETLSVDSGNTSCDIFFDANECLKCSASYYLDEKKKCIEVPLEKKIKNCLYYRFIDECESCVTGYYLQDTFCKPALAKNCSIYKDEKECESCPKGYGFRIEADLTNCIKIELENCEKHVETIDYPFECEKCDQHHFLDDEKNCQKVEIPIEFCKEYIDKNHCNKCEDQKALSEAKDGCFASSFILKNTDENCGTSFIISHPQCDVCLFGHYWEKGKCKKCEYLTPASGCMMCDPNDQFKCLICMPGFFMNNKESCIRVAVDIDEIDDEEGTKIKDLVGLFAFLVFLWW